MQAYLIFNWELCTPHEEHMFCIIQFFVSYVFIPYKEGYAHVCHKPRKCASPCASIGSDQLPIPTHIAAAA